VTVFDPIVNDPAGMLMVALPPLSVVAGEE
jgi:hypothetical protein